MPLCLALVLSGEGENYINRGDFPYRVKSYFFCMLNSLFLKELCKMQHLT